MVILFFPSSTEFAFEVIIIGKNKPKAYKRIITIDAIIKALIALIFIKIILRLSSCQISEEIVLWLKRLSPTEKIIWKKS